MKRLIAVVGPTAVGKSRLALSLAGHIGGEIINADSRQVYRYMDIGTGKPSHVERQRFSHHLIDVVNPDEDFSLALYLRMASDAIESVHQRGGLPLLVGGSGLYVWSLLEGWKIPSVAPNDELRREMEERAEKEGIMVLYRELQAINPMVASKIHPHNVRRVIRSLEIYREKGEFALPLRDKKPPEFSVLVIGLTMDRSELYGEIDRRVDKMVQMGLVSEVEGLLQKGYDLSLPAMSGIGYRQIGLFIRGEISLPLATDRIKFETHRLARHQYTWFRLDDPRIRWLGEVNREAEAVKLLKNF
jgi:tRNA dimethylallyltransferase